MEIIKFNQFIKLNENLQDAPEEYIKNALIKIKKRIDSLFEKATDDSVEDDGEENPDEVMTLGQAMEKGKKREQKNSKMTLTDMGLQLESSELSTHSATLDNVTFKFTDNDGWYNLYVAIPLEDGKPEDDESDFEDTDIKNCSIKFKKYNLDNDLVGQIGPRTVKTTDVDESLLIDLKIELDDEYGNDQEEFEIETE
jgi:hypothetical protein